MSDPLLRMIDANANRTREALRVMEDAARFALDDAPLMGILKSLRHDLQGAMSLLPADRAQLLASRDTPEDVGTTVKTTREMERTGLAGVCAAAASRLTEALRSMEESAKALGAPGAAAAFESLRYRAYTADAALTQRLGAWGARKQWTLCVLLTESLCGGRDWLGVARAAIDGGADCLQLREKNLDGAELLARARALVALARPRNASVIINDRPDIALLANADGVHLGQTDLSAVDVRTLAATRLLIGVSTENMEQARAALAAGANYCGVGPMFTTTTKEKPRLAGPTYLRAYLADPALAAFPHLAIGGITPENVDTLVAAGVRGIAVSSCVCSAADPAGVARSLAGAVRRRAALE